MSVFDPRSTDARLLYNAPTLNGKQIDTMYHNAPLSTRNHFHEPPSFIEQATTLVKPYVSSVASQIDIRTVNLESIRRFNFRQLISVTTLLTVIWVWVLYGGERTVFENSIASCNWANWEQWPATAKPHHLIFVADPQLVDPHTYPGRPWPLSSLTVTHTDLYMHRIFSRMQNELYPDTVFFLGDLFDGGREWATTQSKSPDPQYHRYKDKFWLNEYRRYGKVFFNNWIRAGSAPRQGQPGRKIISTLPGNHDLGFADGIQIPVRNRYHAYFGMGNRVDIVANHTFVSVDTVSLSAMNSEADTHKAIWKPTMDFLEEVQPMKTRAMVRELRLQNGQRPDLPYKHQIVETQDLEHDQLPSHNTTGFEGELPTILLSHVPLYREPGTPCGPLREHWPPAPRPKEQTEPVFPDHRNAITVARGYQYQNVLTPEISNILTEKVGEVQYAFSGDDHDYCELVHMGYTGAGSGIREITVKSISWAMGVRRPGFLMASLWNEIDEHGKRKTSSSGSSKSQTMQTHLCLLPDQLGMFIRYALLFGFTMAILLVRAAFFLSNPSKSRFARTEAIVLPTTSAEADKAAASYQSRHTHSSAASNSSTTPDNTYLCARSATARAKSVSPARGYGLPPSIGPSGYGSPVHHGKYSLPLVSHAGYFGPSEEENVKEAFVTTVTKTKKPLKGMALLWAEFIWGLKLVAIPVFSWYFYLIWTN